MLRSYNGIDIIRRGDFWNLFAGEWVLYGRRVFNYEIFPRPLFIIIGPLIGFVYALTLPIIGIAIMIALTTSKIIWKTGEIILTTASLSWRPAEVCLSGRRGRPQGLMQKKERDVVIKRYRFH